MFTSYGPAPSSKTEGPGLHHLRTIAPLRIGAGLILLFLYAMEGGVHAYQMVWKHLPWDFVAVLEKAHMPWPQVLAPAAAGIALVVSVFWVLGFLTRLFSIVFLPVNIGAIIVVERLNAESQAGVCWLFLLVTITLILYGSGLVSVDALFHLGSRPKKKSRY